MALPEPQPGLVIRYAYLWRSEANQGRRSGAKDRPCAVVLAVARERAGTTVVVAPITHTKPSEPGRAIEIPAATKTRLGLDHERSWIVTNDLNYFVWPGPDLRPVNPRELRRGFAYGYLPEAITRGLIKEVRDLMRAGRAALTNRDDAT